MVEATNKSEEIRDWARSVLDRPITSFTPVKGGRNASVFRVEDEAGHRFALKVYPQDGRGRQQAEAHALAYMARVGITNVPRILVEDERLGVVLLSWIDGEPLTRLDDEDVREFGRFQAALSDRADDIARRQIGEASEACLSAGRIVAQTEKRMGSIEGLTARSPSVQSFVNEMYLPAFEKAVENARTGTAALGLTFDGLLTPALRTLIPSDFGAHNALRTASGELAFLDFEYFGWDDPVTSLCNFVQHPAMQLNTSQKSIYLETAVPEFTASTLSKRYQLFAPLFACRWIAIILSELAPPKWQDRHGARGEDWDTTRKRQLALSQRLFDAYLQP